jgi:hypothetical protein
VVISCGKLKYNHHRRHSSLGYQPPARYAAMKSPMNDSCSLLTSYRVRSQMLKHPQQRVW